jgi:beta-glucosidase
MPKRTCRYFDSEVLYPFGYGLGYSAFRYSNPRVSEIASAKAAVKISVDVANTGMTAADEVLQLYLRSNRRGYLELIAGC